VPFPNGESYAEVAARMRPVLAEIVHHYPARQVMIVGHRATWYALKHWLAGVPLERVVAAPWAWQPGWEYRLDTNVRVGQLGW
jgi:broad specificity phosphatase PhoE